MAPVSVAAAAVVLVAGCATASERAPRSHGVAKTRGAAMQALRWRDGCPRGLRGWRVFRDGLIDMLLAPSETFDDPLAGGSRRYISLERTQREAARAGLHITSCSAAHPLGTAEWRATHNLRRFVAAVGRPERPGHKGGFSVSDAEVQRRAASAVALPPLLASQPFLAALSRPATYRRAVAMIDKHNRGLPRTERWRVLLFRSRFLKTFDRVTYGRLLVVVPGERTERWVQFGIHAPGATRSSREVHSFSVVAVTRPAARAKDTRRVVHIVDFWRDVQPDGAVRVRTRLDAGHESSNCYHCHKLGVVPLRPDAELRFDKKGTLVVATSGARAGDKVGEVARELNRRVRAYGAPSFGGLLDTEAFGPALGPPGQTRGAAFMRDCTRPYHLDDDAIARVRSHMRCASCHDGRQQGVINYPQALRTDLDMAALAHPRTHAPQSLLAAFVVDGAMPPRSHLQSRAERAALAECLMREYYDPEDLSGLLVDWLRQE